MGFQVLRDKRLMQEWARDRRKEGQSIALVPTMGYLHQGHLSLVQEAKKRAHKVVVSIYVNPEQFAAGEDLAVYPRDFEGDLEQLKALEVDIVFNPQDLYVRGDSGHETWVRVERLEKPLCGQSRPSFFRGVATVVTKLFNIVQPDVAMFGKKDYQQWRLICRMVRDLDFDVEVVGCPLLREPDGLAMSSRNVRLSQDERQKALSISRSLQAAKNAYDHGETDASILAAGLVNAITSAGGKVDYATIVDQATLQAVDQVNEQKPAVVVVAAWFGPVRLLDNIELPQATDLPTVFNSRF